MFGSINAGGCDQGLSDFEGSPVSSSSSSGNQVQIKENLGVLGETIVSFQRATTGRELDKLHGILLKPQQERTEVVEAAGGQALREVGGKQETSEEGEEEVVAVAGQGVAGAAGAAAAREDLPSTPTTSRHVIISAFEPSNVHRRPHPVEQRHRVEQEGQHEGSRPQEFAPLGELQLQEPAGIRIRTRFRFTGRGLRT